MCDGVRRDFDRPRCTMCTRLYHAFIAGLETRCPSGLCSKAFAVKQTFKQPTRVFPPADAFLRLAADGIEIVNTRASSFCARVLAVEKIDARPIPFLLDHHNVCDLPCAVIVENGIKKRRNLRRE
jgi:hypothetical protein